MMNSWRHFVSVAPLAALGLAALSGALWSSSVVGSMGLLLTAMVFCRPSWGWRSSAVFLMILVAWRSEELAARLETGSDDKGSEYVEGILILGARNEIFEDQRFGNLRVEGSEERRVMVMKASSFQAGERLMVRGKLFRPDVIRNPDEFSLGDLWKRQSVQRGLSIMEGKSLGLIWWMAPIRWTERWRGDLEEGITRGLEDGSVGEAVIKAMVLGDKPPAKSEISQAFRESGAMHVFAVSGLHVTLVGAIAWLVLVNFGVPRRAGVFLVLLVMLAYAMITGARPPAVRATMMAFFFLGAFLLRRRPSLFNALSLSLIFAVVWNPHQVKEIGFQLSYGVLLAIGVGVGTAYRLTGRMAEVDSFFPVRLLGDWSRRWLGVRKYFAALGATSIAAWAGSMPFLFWHFGVVTPISILTSLVLIPLTTVILALGFLGTFLGWLSPDLGSLSNRVNAGVASMAYHSAQGFADVSFGHWDIGRRKPADWVVFDPGDGGAASFLDLGNGVMIDVGSERFYHRSLRSILGRWGAKVETLALSHPDGDHVGAAHLVLEEGGLERAVIPVVNARSPSYRDFLKNAEQAGCSLLTGTSGEFYSLGENVRLEIIREGMPVDRGIADNRTMVMRVHWKGWRILVAADLGLEDEIWLLEKKVDLSADVLLLGRHQYGNSINLPFVKATGVKVIVTSSSNYPPYEKPPQRWLDLMERSGVRVFDQARTGAVLLDFEEESLALRGFLEPEKVVTLNR